MGERMVSDERNPRSLSALYVHPSYRGPKGAEGGHSRRVMNGERERIMSETAGRKVVRFSEFMSSVLITRFTHSSFVPKLVSSLGSHPAPPSFGPASLPTPTHGLRPSLHSAVFLTTFANRRRWARLVVTPYGRSSHRRLRRA